MGEVKRHYVGNLPLRAEVVLASDYDALAARLDEVLIKDRGKTNEINILTAENAMLRERIAELEGRKARLCECVDVALNGQGHYGLDWNSQCQHCHGAGAIVKGAE